MKTSKINSLFILLGILLATLLSSCTSSIKRSNSNYIEKDYEISDFNKIQFQGAYNIELTHSDAPYITVKTSEEIHENIKVWVDNEMLHIKTEIKNIGADEIKLLIGIDQLNYLKIEGGAFLTTDGYLEFNDLDVRIEGGAHIDMQLKVNKLKAHAEGAVNMQFEGVAYELIAISEGAGNIDADELKTQIVDCHVAGVGNASVYATESLTARVEGLGKIGYRGNPTVNKKIDGIGIIYKK